MWFLYLDESGDFGFDFVNKHPSKFFTITVVAVHGKQGNRDLRKAVRKTLERKLNPKHKRIRLVHELKGTKTTLPVKKYCLQQLENSKVPYMIFSLTMDKRKLYSRLVREKERVYNYLARRLLDTIRFENANTRVYLSIDKSKSKPEIADFNQYIERSIQARLDPNVPLHILHTDSQDQPGLQVADMFCWGIFRKYERGSDDWYACYEQRIRLDELLFK